VVGAGDRRDRVMIGGVGEMDIAPKTIGELLRRLPGLKLSLARAVDQALNDRIMRVEARLSRIEWVIERIEIYLDERVGPVLCVLDMRFNRLEARMALLEKTVSDGFRGLRLTLTKRTNVGVASMVGGRLSENLGAIGQGLGGIVAQDDDRRIKGEVSASGKGLLDFGWPSRRVVLAHWRACRQRVVRVVGLLQSRSRESQA